jgi:hypothetical protein
MLAALLMVIATSAHGRVLANDQPMPGVAVSIGAKTVFTDRDGLFVLSDLPSGSQEIEYKLDGVFTERRSINVHAGENALPDQAIRFVTEGIELTCAMPCTNYDPATKWERPSCRDYYLDDSLQASLKSGDRSALALLESRYETTFTLSERHRIGGMLLKQVSDDSKVWDELIRLAEDAVQFGPSDDETQTKFDAYCKEHNLVADDYSSVIFGALWIASVDPRSRPLLLRALKSKDQGLVFVAIDGFATQHDEGSLAAIAESLERLGEDAHYVVTALADFKSDAADGVAMKYLWDSDKDEYRARRDHQP